MTSSALAQLCLLSILPALALCQCLGSSNVTVTGTLTCAGMPIRRTTLKLVQELGFVPNKLAEGSTDGQGRFYLTAVPFEFFRRNKPNWQLTLYVGFNYRYNNNKKAFSSGPSYVHLLDFHTGYHDIGEIAINLYACNTYMRFFNAVQDFNKRTGRQVRALRHINSRLPQGSVPFTEWRWVRLPKKYLITNRIAKHELAHAVRNKYDGDLDHFRQDAQLYGGVETHNCSTKSSVHFAFNEGWAFYWAGECRQHEFTKQKDVAGDVAKMLRTLQKRCNTSDNDMVVVLEKHPGSIHSFDEFRSAHNNLFACV
ncbi:hypothetical protein BWQ96_09312 [Gracilariopsis chorda]|uniref:Uncharacterized protein n=1 Tax=Gracilariopsis chorda TaxID=448386 RepID=A0A2V3IFZ6_9FLOR|nr:hypothetical protein BWQ96_09312 [Gracilariopsis chorda]|eukprot:PXF40981.1 hypothetical protein BWQ96_09312 [Gracilariopsis chorda]